MGTDMYTSSILKKHAAVYPLMQPTDAVKLIYQETFGGGHMIKSEETALEYIRCEYAALSHIGEPFRCESLGKVSRVFLDGTLTDTELSLIAKMFCVSARLYAVGFADASDEVKKKFLARIGILRELCRDGQFGFTPTELDTYLEHCRAAGYPAVSHSERYRKAYRPAYRVIDSRYVRLIPCIRDIASRLNSSGKRVVVAIDGKCASGKTTAARLLAGIFDAEVIHMDDFFLPPELRTHERLCEIGGNVHYERFESEILPHLRDEFVFNYRVFDCAKRAYSDTPRKIEPSRLIIVEGSYALHPRFGDYCDLSVFIDIAPDKQLERIKKRNGEKLLARFQSDWIPMEERYFDAYNIRENCDFII